MVMSGDAKHVIIYDVRKTRTPDSVISFAKELAHFISPNLKKSLVGLNLIINVLIEGIT
jgi:hypothetical protein